MTRENRAQLQRGIFSHCCRIVDCKVLRRVWKILDRAFDAQTIAGEDSSAADHQERTALIGDRLLGMDVQQLCRADWYMSRIAG